MRQQYKITEPHKLVGVDHLSKVECSALLNRT